ncbi:MULTISPECIES: glycosyltransferase family 4 protein [Snodgrassella]|uniref:glycosyltransferase family 4 protein n=1 Tax=Snodgrassella TaxID=1193515 RepID=UPI000815A03D|nr:MULTISPECIES: glycosyltransferase family 1 protein [Snodgrassella]SCC01462.1 Glycosyltransferase involved in cell wall bisynthesis [Snodgrassella sp. R-53583]
MHNSKIIFDISELLSYINVHRRYSGIQRVVAMILNEFQKISDQQIWICYTSPVGEVNQEYFAYDLTKLNFQYWESPDLTYDFFRKLGILGPGSLILKYKHNKVKYYFHRTRFDIAAFFKRHHRFIRRGVSIDEWKLFRRSIQKKNKFVKLKDVIKSNDKLVLLDATWRQVNVEMYQMVKLLGVKIYSLVYDLIPIIFPQFVTQDLTYNFYSWLIRSTEYTDYYLTDSQSSKKDLLEFLHTYKINKEVNVLPLVQVGIQSNTEYHQYDKSIHLLPNDLSSVSRLGDIYKNILSDKYILCVGTIDIRKNIWRLVLAWKYLLDKGYCDLPRLVLVGRKGWNNDHLWNLLNSTGNLYGYVIILDNTNDVELDLLYKNCLFVVMVSMAEGWGLPVGEALAYGKSAVVSNATSLPEVGMDLVEYCDPFSIQSIASSIEKLIYQPDYRQELENKIKNTKLRNWADVANDLASLLQSKH